METTISPVVARRSPHRPPNSALRRRRRPYPHHRSPSLKLVIASLFFSTFIYSYNHISVALSLSPLFAPITVRFLKRAKSNTIVLTGLSGAGKTVLFYQVSLSIPSILIFHFSHSHHQQVVAPSETRLDFFKARSLKKRKGEQLVKISYR